MHNHSAPSSIKKHFTLIELLVVITIISILASLLLPALRKAIGMARQAGCSSNLKQIGISAIMYSNEWNGALPTNNSYWVKDFHGYTHMGTGGWLSKLGLSSDAKEGTVLHCPQTSASTTPDTSEYWNKHYYYNTYAQNYFRGGGYENGRTDYAPKARSLNSEVFYFSDGGGVLNTNNTFRYFYMVNLDAWGGYLGQYKPFGWYFFDLGTHPRSSSSFLMGDNSAQSIPWEEYRSFSRNEKVRFSGGGSFW